MGRMCHVVTRFHFYVFHRIKISWRCGLIAPNQFLALSRCCALIIYSLGGCCLRARKATSSLWGLPQYRALFFADRQNGFFFFLLPSGRTEVLLCRLRGSPRKQEPFRAAFVLLWMSCWEMDVFAKGIHVTKPRYCHFTSGMSRGCPNRLSRSLPYREINSQWFIPIRHPRS